MTKTIKGFAFGLVAAIACAAFAVSRPFTGTIDTPGVMSWVDGSNATVAPLATFNSETIFYDSNTGYTWTVNPQTLATATPTARAFSATTPNFFYTSLNCAGTAYIATDDPIGVVRTYGGYSPPYAQPYTAGTKHTGVSIVSTLSSGTCYNFSYPYTTVYEPVGPLTAPTLPAGPWHLEVR
jgi:hypothetical protein